MKTFLVTGGAGFIGSALARALIARGDAVVVVDNLLTGKREQIPAGAEFIEGDLSRPETLSRLPNRYYAGVAHLAAQSSGAIGQKNPYLDMQTNVGATMLLSRWCIEHGISRFVFTSSMTVYGNANRIPLDEESICYPIAYYGASKLASEHYLRIASSDGLQPTSLRLYNVYGPGQNLGNLEQGMASIYLAYLLDGGQLPVTGSLDRFRDFVFIDDVVAALLAVLDRISTPSPVYNIGSGQTITVRDLIALLINILGLPADHPVDVLGGSANDVFGSIADIGRAGSDLDWHPKIPLEIGLPRMVAWARGHMAAAGAGD